MTCSNHQLVTNHINSLTSHTQQLRHSIHWGRNKNGTMHMTKLNNLTSPSHCTPAWTTWLVHILNRDNLTLRSSSMWTVSLSKVIALLHGEVCIETQDHMHYQNWVGPGTVCVQNRAHPWWRLLSGEQQLLGYGDALHQQQTAWASSA